MPAIVLLCCRRCGKRFGPGRGRIEEAIMIDQHWKHARNCKARSRLPSGKSPRSRLPVLPRLLKPRERQFLQSFVAEEQTRGRRIWSLELSDEQRARCRDLEKLGYMDHGAGWATTETGRLALETWEL